MKAVHFALAASTDTVRFLDLEPLEPRLLLASDGPFAVADFFPLDVGNSWNYDYKGSDSGTGTATIDALGIVNVNGINTTHFQWLNSFGQSQQRYYNLDGGGLDLQRFGQNDGFDSYTQTYLPMGIPLMPAMVELGDLFTHTNIAYNGSGGGTNWSGFESGSVEIVGFEAIITPVGVFEAARVKVTESWNESGPDWSGMGTRSETWWLAEGIGIIKLQGVWAEKYSDGDRGKGTYSFELTGTNLVPNPLNIIDVVVGDGGVKKVTYTETDGTRVQASVSKGQSTFTFSGANLMLIGTTKGIEVIADAGVDLDQVMFNYSSLSTTARFTNDAGGDGLATVMRVIGDQEIGSFGGKKVALDGDGIQMTGDGLIATVQLDRINDGTQITMPGTGRATGVSIKVNMIGDQVDMEIATGLATMSALYWMGGHLDAPWAKSMKFKEGFGASMDLTSPLGYGGGATLGSMKAGGQIGADMPVAWNIAGGAGPIGAASAKNLTVDVEGDARGVKIKTPKGALTPTFVNSWFIVDGLLGAATLGVVDPDNGGDSFGVQAGDFKSIAFATTDGDKAKVTPADLLQIPPVGDFMIMIL